MRQKQTLRARLKKGPVDVHSLFTGKVILRNVRSNETPEEERWDFGWTDRGKLITAHQMADYSVEVYVSDSLEHLRQTAVPSDVLRRLERKLGVAPARPRSWVDEYLENMNVIRQLSLLRDAAGTYQAISEYFDMDHLLNLNTAARARSSREPWFLLGPAAKLA